MSRSRQKNLATTIINLKFDGIQPVQPKIVKECRTHREITNHMHQNNRIRLSKGRGRYSLSDVKPKLGKNAHFLEQFQAFNSFVEEKKEHKSAREDHFLEILNNEEYQQKLRKKEKEEIHSHWAEEIVSKIDSSIQVAESKLILQKKKKSERIVLNFVGEFAREKTKNSGEFQTHEGENTEENDLCKAKIEDRLRRVILGRKNKTIEKVENCSPKQFWKGLVKEQRKLLKHLNPQFPMKTTSSMLTHFNATLDLARDSRSSHSRPSTSGAIIRKNKSYI